ncbi:AMP-binding protein [Marinomonas primoryensis]|uniref:AMP-binding enzyme n=1 Tax=Marinomonas primoryensis TaxID=178399 RepID=A0A859CZ50_9GAMM|nr:AMP-binding protein [Marinomonas primoryensis]QKK81878.1 AMP-binding enzyme [Marinomonas primoryensis]
MEMLSVFEQLPTPSVNAERNEKGEIVLESNMALLPYDKRVGDWLKKWAKEKPDTVFIAERKNIHRTQDGWRKFTYAQFLKKVEKIAQGIYASGVNPDRPILIISANSIDHALVKMAAMHIGIPVTSLSVAYSMFEGKYDRLAAAVENLNPSIIYAEDGQASASALASLSGDHLVLVSSGLDALDKVQQATTTVHDLSNVKVTAIIDELYNRVDADTAAKYMLTSGSTGNAKVVVVTHRMMCSNQQMIVQCLPFLETTPPVVLDWLPWSHTFGTNHNFNLVLRNGGSLYVDEGRPLPGMVEKTAANILEVKPTLYFNVPKGYEALLPLLKQDKTLSTAFFENLQMVFYAAASLSEPVWRELKTLAAKHNCNPLFSTEWGSTETAPANTSVHWVLEKIGNIGIPMPGVQIKLVPNDNKLEMCIKGPNVFRAYLNDAKNTHESFDLDGFYKIGDAGYLADPENPSAGIMFDGRVSEDFKMSTGTWVCVATMKKRGVEALKGLVTDVLIAGHDKNHLSLIVFPTPSIYKLVGGELNHTQLLESALLNGIFKEALDEINAQARGSSQKIKKIVLAQTPPSIELGEVTDKGNFNQRKLLTTRQEFIAEIYSCEGQTVVCG